MSPTPRHRRDQAISVGRRYRTLGEIEVLPRQQRGRHEKPCTETDCLEPVEFVSEHGTVVCPHGAIELARYGVIVTRL